MSDQPGPPYDIAELTTALRAYLDVAGFADALASLLEAALPASLVRVERAPTMRERLARRPGEVRRVVVRAADRELVLDIGADGRTTATSGHTVRGVMLARTPVSVQSWLDELVAVLRRTAEADAAARAALERLLFAR